MGGETFDGDLSVEEVVSGSPHRGHATATDLFDQLETLAGHRLDGIDGSGIATCADCAGAFGWRVSIQEPSGRRGNLCDARAHWRPFGQTLGKN